ncbi:helix-turn-helix transcriptional regulator [Ottowia pentelensis]|uniref:Helix-turn-helix transcriptional regulator n=1 Tax=Ottowia pentelensis TaxID=511108 RepID=A0ABV6PW96_9BURK
MSFGDSKKLPFRSVRAGNVHKTISCARSTSYKIMSTDPSFPKPFRITPRIVVFDEAELLAWRASKAAA